MKINEFLIYGSSYNYTNFFAVQLSLLIARHYGFIIIFVFLFQVFAAVMHMNQVCLIKKEKANNSNIRICDNYVHAFA